MFKYILAIVIGIAVGLTEPQWYPIAEHFFFVIRYNP